MSICSVSSRFAAAAGLAVTFAVVSPGYALQTYSDDFESYDLTTGPTDRLRDQNALWSNAPAARDVITDEIFQDTTAENGSKVLRVTHTATDQQKNGLLTDDMFGTDTTEGITGAIQGGFDIYFESGYGHFWLVRSSTQGLMVLFDHNGIRARTAGGYVNIKDGDDNDVTNVPLGKWLRVAVDMFIVDPNNPDHTGVSTFSVSVYNLTDDVAVGSLIDQELFGNAPFLDDFNTQIWGRTNAEAGAAVRYDNIFFNEVPEPASLGLLALGGLLMTTRRR